MNTLFPVAALLLFGLLSGCATPPLYDELGGNAGLERISGRFIAEIGNDPEIRPYFDNTNLDRFHAMFAKHLCSEVGGPCVYDGDDMVNVHIGMEISEAHFNRVVDLLINAMNQEGVPHRVQNRLLAKLAPMRGEIIYR